jgi:DNA-binding transcriptional LysR family regulator
VLFASVKDKPRFVEEHDGWAGVYAAVAAGNGVAISSDAFNYLGSDRVKQVHLTPEPQRVSIGMITRKGKLSAPAEKFCQCAKDAFASIH